MNHTAQRPSHNGGYITYHRIAADTRSRRIVILVYMLAIRASEYYEMFCTSSLMVNRY